jgi:thioredoxin-related protein
MKSFLYLLYFSLCFVGCIAQQKTPETVKAPYLRFPTVPPIDLIQLDSTHLTKEKLQKNQNTLIMFFSPTCDHCQHQTNDLIAGMDSLKNIQIVLASYQPYAEIQEFYHKYELFKYGNIKIGRDSKFMLPPFFGMKNLPYLALYDQKGNLLTTFEGNVTVQKLTAAFSQKK